MRKIIARRSLLAQQPYTAAHTRKTHQELKFEVLNHPSYSPDLAPSDFHLFGSLKGAVRGHLFADDDKVKEAGHD
jgi:histone-lysine N-methyltransferase SETMAR